MMSCLTRPCPRCDRGEVQGRRCWRLRVTWRAACLAREVGRCPSPIAAPVLGHHSSQGGRLPTRFSRHRVGHLMDVGGEHSLLSLSRYPPPCAPHTVVSPSDISATHVVCAMMPCGQARKGNGLFYRVDRLWLVRSSWNRPPGFVRDTGTSAEGREKAP